jgi:hypothetical protein
MFHSTLLKPSRLEKAHWKNYEGKAQWDCQVALRGADFASETMKYYSTSVIRHKLSGVMRVGGLVNAQFNFILLPGRDAIKWHLTLYPGFNVTHWAEHVYEAAQILSIPVIHLTAAAWAAVVKGTGSTEDSLMLPKTAITEIQAEWPAETADHDSPF